MDMQYDTAEDMIDALSSNLNKNIAKYEGQILKAVMSKQRAPPTPVETLPELKKALKEKQSLEAQIRTVNDSLTKLKKSQPHSSERRLALKSELSDADNLAWIPKNKFARKFYRESHSKNRNRLIMKKI